MSIEKITVVESDSVFWKRLILSNPVIRDSIKQKRLHPLIINIGVPKSGAIRLMIVVRTGGRYMHRKLSGKILPMI